MKRNSVSLALACITLLLPGSSLCQADSIQPEPIVLSGGGLFGDCCMGTVLLMGNRGFTLTGVISASRGNTYEPHNCIDGCAPGTPIHVGAAARHGSDLSASFTLDGNGYPNLDDDGAFVQFNGPAVLAPPLRPRRATVMTTFDLTGELFYTPDPSDPTSLPVLEGFGGQGKVTLFLERKGDAWMVARTRYQLQPAAVPQARDNASARRRTRGSGGAATEATTDRVSARKGFRSSLQSPGCEHRVCNASKERHHDSAR